MVDALWKLNNTEDQDFDKLLIEYGDLICDGSDDGDEPKYLTMMCEKMLDIAKQARRYKHMALAIHKFQVFLEVFWQLYPIEYRLKMLKEHSEANDALVVVLDYFYKCYGTCDEFKELYNMFYSTLQHVYINDHIKEVCKL